MDRRTFIQTTVAGLAGSAALAAEDKAIAIIDTHQHLWDVNKFKLPWLKTAPALAKNYLIADYLKAVEGLNVVQSVYMEVDVDPTQQQAEAEYVIAICKHWDMPGANLIGPPMKGAVISGRPASEEFKNYITQFKDSKYIKGVRQVLHNEGTRRGVCLEKSFINGIRLLGELGMSYDICIRPAELSDAAKLVDACPDTHFILDHCGNANVQTKDRTQWQKDMADLAKRRHLVCKVSGIVASAKPDLWLADDLAPIINHTLEVFGPDRVVFGGDWPVCTLAATYKQWVDALKSIVKERKDEDKRKLFHDNAVRVYRLA